jgi:ribonuclease T1
MRRRSSQRRPRQLPLIIAAGALLILLAALQLMGGEGAAPRSPRAGQPAVSATSAPRPSSATPAQADRARSSDLPAADASQLPPEARTTLALIAQDGPFPFDKDGATFQNREGLLPAQPPGYYREYTVITPGEDDRGARRIIAGRGGERYYTSDHYASFVEVLP